MADSERIKQLLEYLNVSANRLSKDLGLATPQIFYDIKNGRCGISKDLARRIKEKFINISYVWLLTGMGEMIEVELPEAEKPVMVDIHDRNENKDKGSIQYPMEVPLVDIGMVGHVADSYSPYRKLTLEMENYGDSQVKISFPDSKVGDLAIRNYGDSMAPIIPSGAVMLIRRIEHWEKYMGFGNTFVIVLIDGRRLTKHIVGYGTDHSYYLAKSYNNEIEDEEIPISMIKEVWKVVSILSLQGW